MGVWLIVYIFASGQLTVQKFEMPNMEMCTSIKSLYEIVKPDGKYACIQMGGAGK